ncbi:GyrI-like domain-containing protein [Methylobacterium sp. C25]|uniref:GyrI-like domain-containing protein n=1 Tax=Methylobacterium sp. C25 TaxID=2721622 RepID=UPI001F3B5C1D|nr:GyrI-like domain-containing protein [Methylobacterium sp. C25]
MIRPRSATAGLAAMIVLALAAVPVLGEEPATSKIPSPAEANPLSTTTAPDTSAKPPGTAMPLPDKALMPPAAAGGAPARSTAAPARETLVPAPAEPNDVEEVILPAKPAAIISGKATWEEAVSSLRTTFARIEDELAKAGIRPTGRPISVFTKTEDNGFQFEAMIPIEAAPASGPTTGDGLHFGATPSGKALRFRHAGTYDEISGTYDTLIAYFDAKDIALQDRFIEEYVTDISDAPDVKLDINIYALPK